MNVAVLAALNAGPTDEASRDDFSLGLVLSQLHRAEEWPSLFEERVADLGNLLFDDVAAKENASLESQRRDPHADDDSYVLKFLTWYSSTAAPRLANEVR